MKRDSYPRFLNSRTYRDLLPPLSSSVIAWSDRHTSVTSSSSVPPPAVVSDLSCEASFKHQSVVDQVSPDCHWQALSLFRQGIPHRCTLYLTLSDPGWWLERKERIIKWVLSC
jgi:hypothetical protein